MDSVVATVSGYHGSDRFKLIKLINHTGANYVGSMSKSTTHLVCWQFEGSKYMLAKNLGTKIVSHQWFEDCEREGKRLPEGNYLMQSGQQVRPLSWEPPVACPKESLLARKNDTLFYDRSNICNDARSTEIENGSPGPSFRLSSEHEESTSYASILSGKHKRSIHSASGSTTKVEPTRKSRRLAKKKSSRDIYESAIFDCDQECSPTENCDEIYTTTAASNDSDDLRSDTSLTILDCEQECSPTECTPHNVTAAPNDSNGLRNKDAMIPQGSTLQDGFYIGENRNEELADVEDITELNNFAASNGSNILSDDVLASQERMSLDFEDDDAVLKDVDVYGKSDRLPTPTELSCVICWTDFSSTRGVLPCGHRFCYSCIQDWADHMASRRKVSTCPLCKASFVSITKVEDAASTDQKIYSQTIPDASSAAKDIFVLSDWEISGFGAQGFQFSAASVCCVCRSREPEDLLVSCHICRNSWVHSYCLDPPLDPWTCINCRRLRMLYRRIH
ncbi:BRCT domain [Macleaya cordata]|uniref:BRCT domain n=1 Tax=Macleaya cordata TaxID=56857 RepID=A0A200Q7L3_MACCD|nr:BRCT domain [Macleaya cordata]